MSNYRRRHRRSGWATRRFVRLLALALLLGFAGVGTLLLLIASNAA